MLVKGYLTNDFATGLETLYAEFPCGKVLQCGPHETRDSFAGGTWTKAAAVPETAEFIGNYFPPAEHDPEAEAAQDQEYRDEMAADRAANTLFLPNCGTTPR